jgi:hypothetical protein
MPHIPDSLHDTHDLELVAAFAAGDATGPALDAATTLVASCATCAQLHQDLRAIAAAMPAVPAPARTRDFRISHEQAARLRPTGIRGILAAFGSPRLSFAAPLGTGMAALGIIGVLVASGGAPLGGATDGAGSPALDAAAQVAPESAGKANMGALAESAAPAASADPNLTLSAPASPATTMSEQDAPAATVTASDDGSRLLLAAGLVLVILGVGLVAIRLLARGLARAP